MYTATLLPLLLATLTTASPTARASNSGDNANANAKVYHGVSLRIRTTDAFTHPAVYEPAPVQINHLTNFGGVSASEISFDGSSSNIDIHSVECRAYKDAEGVVPGSKPFTEERPAELSTGLVEVGSVLCYVVGEGEGD